MNKDNKHSMHPCQQACQQGKKKEKHSSTVQISVTLFDHESEILGFFSQDEGKEIVPLILKMS